MSNQLLKSIVFVQNSNATSKHYNTMLSTELSINISTVPTITDVFPLLSDPSFNPTCIAINIDECQLNLDVELIDIMHSLSTMIKCTMYRSGTVTKTRKTSLIAVVSDNTSVSLIKNIMLIPTVDHIGIRVCNSITYNEVKDDIENYVNGSYKKNKVIKRLIYPTTATVKTTVTNSITLTPRQTQILNLVASRGASNKVIARMLNLSESTVKLHLGIIFKKYGVKNRTQLAVSAIETLHKEIHNV
jgi:DNA-binding CsgD family transcriptional regulator